MGRLTVGFHDFLNSRPLLHPLRHGLVEQSFDLVIDTPGNLAERFRQGELDMALIPSVEYGRMEDALIVPDLCIASLGPVETVFIFSELALEDIESVCVDPRSRTSVAMVQILFHELYNHSPEMIIGETDPAQMLRSADAGLLIGEHPISIDHEKYVVTDLGELWYRYAGRPFVHALLCTRQGINIETAIKTICEAKRIGLQNRALVAKEEANDILSEQRIYEYLTSRILYDLEDEEISGLSHFLEKAKELSLVANSRLRFYRP